MTLYNNTIMDSAILAIHQNRDFAEELKRNLDQHYIILEKNNLTSLLHIGRLYNLSCIVFYFEHDFIHNVKYLQQFKRSFASIPCIAVINQNLHSLNIAHECGIIGIEKVMPYSYIHKIGNEIYALCIKKKSRILLTEISIDKLKTSYSSIIKEALSIIEINYQKLMTISEIAELMDISECTLSREFTKHNLLTPKKILLQLKVNHAIRLMQNSGLNIREISELSGFSNEKRMSECFRRVYNLAPSEYRTLYIK